MNSELMMKIAAGLRKDGFHHDADRLEAIAKAQGESVVVDGAPLYTAPPSQCTPVARDMQESGGDE